MTTLRFSSRDQLLEALEAQRPMLAKYDADQAKEHKKAEAEFLKKFRAGCREALKWDYETAKARGFNVPIDGETSRYPNPPSCPRSMVAVLDKAVRAVTATRQKSFQVSETGGWSLVYTVLTFDPDPTPQTVC